jgi:hypothetical protein
MPKSCSQIKDENVRLQRIVADKMVVLSGAIDCHLGF